VGTSNPRIPVCLHLFVPCQKLRSRWKGERASDGHDNDTLSCRVMSASAKNRSFCIHSPRQPLNPVIAPRVPYTRDSEVKWGRQVLCNIEADDKACVCFYARAGYEMRFGGVRLEISDWSDRQRELRALVFFPDDHRK